MSKKIVIEEKQKELLELQRKLRLKEELPHLYGFPWYRWAHEFFVSTNRMCLLTAGNQISKSSTQIRKAIHWATSPEMWKELWPSSVGDPNVCWYLYPTTDVATEEFELKWSLFLPKGEMKNHPVYGWTDEWKNNKIYAIQFNTGFKIIFKTYAQQTTDLQTGSVYYIACDEELPIEKLPELQARLNATDGYFSMVFTATLGQEHWRKAIEEKGSEELYPTADKWQVSLFDCTHYMDGTRSPWTDEKINRAIERCASEAEVQRRIHGKFVFGGGLRYEAFSRERNLCKKHDIPSDWYTYSGVDYGSGGESGHPAAMCFVAVSPDFKMGRAFRARRMDGAVTTAQDVLDEYVQVRGNITPVLQTYDWSSKDFHTFASRKGIPFQKAEKDVLWGVTTLNTLFKSGMLKIFDDDPELAKLVSEISTLKSDALKRHASDDLVDSLRYACMSVPWDWTALDDIAYDHNGKPKEPPVPKKKTETDLRREWFFGKKESNEYTPDMEMQDWDELINGFDSE